MWKTIKKISLWVLSIILLLVLTSAAYLYYAKDQVIALVISEMNKELETPVQIEAIDVTIRNFPQAALDLKNVFIQGSFSQEGDTLIFAKEISVSFDFWDIIESDIQINSIRIAAAMINIKESKDKSNYLILKKDTSNNEEGLLVDLNKVELKDCSFAYRDKSLGLFLNTNETEGRLKAHFENNDIIIESRVYAFIHNIEYNKYSYLSNRSINWEGQIHIEDKGRISTESLKLESEGIKTISSFAYQNEIFDLNGKLESSGIDKVYSLVQSQNWYSNESVQKLDGSAYGSFSFSYNPKTKETFNTDFTLSNAQIEIDKELITNINSELSYTSENEVLTIDTLDAKWGTISIAAKGRISQLISTPYVDLNLYSAFDISELHSQFIKDNINSTLGKLEINLNFKNQFKDLENFSTQQLRKVKANGYLNLENIALEFKDDSRNIKNLNASLKIDDQKLRIQRFIFNRGRSDLFVSGYFDNIINYIFDESELIAQIELRAQELKMEDFISNQESNENPNNYDLNFVKDIRFKTSLNVDKFSFGKFYASDLSGQLSIESNIIKGQNIKLKSDQGTYDGQFVLDLQNKDLYKLRAETIARSIDLKEVFISFNEFNQTAISSENIIGKGDVDLNIETELNSNLDFDLNSLIAKANFTIYNGQIINYEPLQALSKFAEIDELKNVTFNKLSNSISIENSNIHIPKMLISSNVINVELSGNHNFENEIDYRLKLRISEVLKKKKKNQTPSEFDEFIIENDADEPHIYIKVLGIVDEPEVSLDKTGIGESIKKDLKKQGEEIKNIFKKEEPEKKKTGIQYTWPEEDEDDG